MYGARNARKIKMICPWQWMLKHSVLLGKTFDLLLLLSPCSPFLSLCLRANISMFSSSSNILINLTSHSKHTSPLFITPLLVHRHECMCVHVHSQSHTHTLWILIIKIWGTILLKLNTSLQFQLAYLIPYTLSFTVFMVHF